MTYVIHETESQCNNYRYLAKLPYPRTCEICGLGPCKRVNTEVDGPTAPFDVVKKAEHYNTHPSGIEAINIVRCLNFNMGCVLKYVMRRHGKEYERSLKSAAYYLEDQHRSGNTMVVGGAVYRLLEDYAKTEPVPQARAFYWAFFSYLDHPVDAHYQLLSDSLRRLLEDHV